MSSLAELLKRDKKIFKLVCGAGNECLDEVERLVYVYSKVGCQFFDVSANKAVVKAAKRGLERSGTMSDRYICVSVGIKGDAHILKARIDGERCQHCRMCENLCENDGIKNFGVVYERCLGCGKCSRVCPANAVEMYSVEKDLDVVLPELVEMGIDCVEFHARVEDEEEVLKKWEQINRNFDGVLSVCIDRERLGNRQILDRLKKMISSRKPFTTIIQADGIPMSGSDDRYKTTLQAVAMGEIIRDANMPVYMFLSGGTNTKSVELANLCGVEFDGVSVGSYARKVVKEYIESPDFYENEVLQKEAQSAALRLVNSVTR